MLNKDSLISVKFEKEFNRLASTLNGNERKSINSKMLINKMGISEAEASSLLNKLVSNGLLKRKFSFKCPNDRCSQEIDIDKITDDIIVCEECGIEFVPMKGKHLLQDIIYELTYEPNKGLNDGIDYIRYFSNDEKRTVIDFEKEKAIRNREGEEAVMGQADSYKIFISHNEKDKRVAAKLVKLISDIGVERSRENIFCSSYQGLGVPVGQTIPKYIRDELRGNVIVLFLLSDNYYQSPASLCEMGAVWVNAKESIPIIIPPFEFKEISGFIENNSGVRLDKKEHLNELRKTIIEKFNISIENSSSWEIDRDDFIEDINQLT